MRSLTCFSTTSYDGGHIIIQKILGKEQTTTRTPNRTLQPHTSNKTIEANLGGYSDGRNRDRGTTFNRVDYFNMLINRLDSSHWNSSDILKWYSPLPTGNYFNVKYKEPVQVEARHKNIPMTAIWVAITFVVFCVICALRVMAYAQRAPNEERAIRSRMREERSISINSLPNLQENNNDNSSSCPRRDAHSDPPPPYLECVTSNGGINNECFDITCEEVPSYSTCCETADNAD